MINPSLYKKIPFDPIKDFAPICDLAISPQMLSVLPGYVNTLAEFIAKAKAAKGALNYSSPGLGTQAQLTVELLKLRAGIDIVHIPFTGGPPAVQALLSKSVRARDQRRADQRQARARRHPACAGGERRGPLVLAAEGADAGGVRLSRLHHRYFRRLVRADRHAEGDRRAARNRDAGRAEEPDVIARARSAGFQIIGGGPEVLAKRVVPRSRSTARSSRRRGSSRGRRVSCPGRAHARARARNHTAQ